MSTSTIKSGDQWIADLKEHSNDPSKESIENFDTWLEEREVNASAIIERLIERTIPEGIASCKSRGSASLALELPIAALETNAFESLKGWLRDQHIRHAIAESDTDAADSKHVALVLVPLATAS